MRSSYKKIAAIAAVLGMVVVPPAFAYPDKPITIVVPWNAGGNADVITRIASDVLASELGQPIVVDNRGGANGAIGLAHVAQSAPDGYTFGVAVLGNATNLPFNQDVPFDFFEDLEAVGQIAKTPFVLEVSAASGITDFANLLETSKTTSLRYANGGPTSVNELAIRLLMRDAGLEATAVPYQGGGAAVTALMGNEVQFYWNNISTALPNHSSGATKIIAVASEERQDIVPDVPTLVDLGHPDLIIENWLGLVAPAGTDPSIIEAVSAAVAQVALDEQASQALIRLGALPAPLAPDEFHAMMVDEFARWESFSTEVRN